MSRLVIVNWFISSQHPLSVDASFIECQYKYWTLANRERNVARAVSSSHCRFYMNLIDFLLFRPQFSLKPYTSIGLLWVLFSELLVVGTSSQKGSAQCWDFFKYSVVFCFVRAFYHLIINKYNCKKSEIVSPSKRLTPILLFAPILDFISMILCQQQLDSFFF